MPTHLQRHHLGKQVIHVHTTAPRRAASGVAAAATAMLLAATAPSPATAESPADPGRATSTAAPRPTPPPSPGPAPARSSSPRPSASPARTTASGAEPEEPSRLTRIDLSAQVADAERLAALLEASNSRVALETRRMDALSSRSNALLERLTGAREVEISAREKAASSRAELVTVEARLARARTVVRDWAFSVYTGGGSHVELSGMLDALSAEADRVGDPLGDLSYLTDQRTRALTDVRALTAEQKRLTAAAEQASATAITARTTIESDKAALDTVIDEQQARIGGLRTLQMAEVQQAGPIASILVGARSPQAQAAVARLQAALTASTVETASVGAPCSDDSGTYPNGLFPGSALCPLWRAPGERLAPRAAAAFNSLSQAYAAQTGSPLCVTDSYRSLSEQFAIKATHGRFAATPGTSRHGLGRALDLCGGVQQFGSPAHLWMKQNAPLYGWFHPSWAAADGPLPEPWHFEYGGA
ncbi:MAG: D-alanyl-D-alanine carboxypeptidase family protein [Dermatophilaceae bacterium]